jgi:hypothetical protein
VASSISALAARLRGGPFLVCGSRQPVFAFIGLPAAPDAVWVVLAQALAQRQLLSPSLNLSSMLHNLAKPGASALIDVGKAIVGKPGREFLVIGPPERPVCLCAPHAFLPADLQRLADKQPVFKRLVFLEPLPRFASVVDRVLFSVVNLRGFYQLLGD